MGGTFSKRRTESGQPWRSKTGTASASAARRWTARLGAPFRRSGPTAGRGPHVRLERALLLFLPRCPQGFRGYRFAGFGEGVYGPLAGAAELEALEEGGVWEGLVHEVG